MLRVVFLVVTLFVASYVSAAEEYPRTLTANDAIQYFAQHPKIEMRKPREGFDFMIKGKDIERYCGTCGTSTGYGTVNYRLNENQVCFDWDNVSFPDSGCFTFVQVSPGGFELQNKHGEQVYAWGSARKVVIKAGTQFKERFGRAILIDLDEMKLGKEQLHAAVIQAMKHKGWQIEKKEADKIVAYLDRHGSTYRVMAKIRGSWIGIGFIQGFEPRGDGWLYNIKYQLLNPLCQ
jgi:hypothetical protein